MHKKSEGPHQARKEHPGIVWMNQSFSRNGRSHQDTGYREEINYPHPTPSNLARILLLGRSSGGPVHLAVHSGVNLYRIEFSKTIIKIF
jgi:hypothetical protein